MPRPPRHSLPSTVPTAIARLTAIVAVGALGATALDATTGGGARSVHPATLRLAAPAVTQPVDGSRLPQLDMPPRRPAATSAVPVRRAAAAKTPHVAVKKPRAPKPRWLPTGTGMWIYQWGKSNHGKAHSVVARARSVGLTTLFVRTGSSHDGFTGAKVLRALLPATAHTNVHVVAWDFPELHHPAEDARRLARAARFNRGHGVHVAAVAPDIETPAEGTRASAARVRTYLKTLRRLLPKDVAILSTVPWPSSARRGHYPYATVAAHSDALLPMAYWYNNAPSLVTARSVQFLRKFHKPVQPVGQGYDGKLDVPSLPHNNLRKQVPAFLSTARKLHVSAVSLWSWQSAPKVTWSALARAKRWFPAGR